MTFMYINRKVSLRPATTINLLRPVVNGDNGFGSTWNCRLIRLSGRDSKRTATNSEGMF